MPGCWPTVVSRSAGLIASGHRPMIRAGYHPARVHLDARIRSAFPRFALLDGPSPLAPAAAVLGGARRPGRDLDQARGPPAARVRWQQAAQPRVPRRRGAGRGRRHPRHVGPALVQPRPPDCGGRGAGRAGRPPRPVRARRSTRRTRASGSTSCSGATVHQAATDDRAERAALVERVVAELRAAGRRPYVVAIGGTGIVGAVGQVLAGLELADGAAAVGSRAGHGRRPVGHRRDPGRAAGRASHGRPARPTSTGSPSRRRSRCAPSIAAIVDELGELDGLAAVDDREIVLDGSPARRRLRPPDRGGRRGDPPAGTDRGDPRRSDLHRQGAGRSHRPGPRRARWTAGRSSSGTPAGRPACSNRSTADG